MTTQTPIPANASLPNTPVQESEEVRTFRIEVRQRASHFYHEGNESPQPGVSWVKAALFFLRGRITAQEAEQLAAQLLSDPLLDTYAIQIVSGAQPSHSTDGLEHTIDVTFLPGVTDQAAENLVRAAHLLGVGGLHQAATGQRYFVQGAPSNAVLHRLASENFSNPVIQSYAVDRPIVPPFVPFQHADDTVEVIPLQTADDARLREVSSQRRLALNLSEMQAIRAYFQGEGREPNEVELETLAQTWSEHCSHKSFKAIIDFNDESGTRTVNGLLASTIRAATERLAKPWVRSAFVDNAGIVAFDEGWDIAFKVETHNHPSALEPFGGANTGLGGVIRDILGVSARPIASTDVLCFGPQNLPDEDVPAGVLHPRRIQAGVTRGIEDYGNKMGIPTVNGAILYHAGYTSNPLVFAGSLGLLPHGSHRSEPQPGDLVVVIGGRTGRDGLRGATFSSMEMDNATSEVAGSAVQIGHPINEKQALEVVLQARDAGLYHAVNDCGAGGLSSAVGEMASTLGATIQLARVPLKYPGLRPWEIWLSEAQERMVFAVPPENWAQFQAICDLHSVQAVSIGTLEATGRLRLYYGDKPVADLSMEFLHHGIPRARLAATWKRPAQPVSRSTAATPDLAASLLSLLAHPNIASKEQVIRRYDHEVQGGTAIKPLVGVGNHGPSDASVLVPLAHLETHSSMTRGVALSAGICPAYEAQDPYLMAWAAVDEALRNAVAVGADPDQLSLLDNFCWGNPNQPDRLGRLVRCAEGCYDAAIAYQAPFISGKDSLNNEFTTKNGERQAIPGTLLISALAIVPDVTRTVTMDLKRPGNHLYIVGDTRPELGSSHYGLIGGSDGGDLPQPVLGALDRMRALHRAIAAGLVAACHDCSEGGIGVALAEMCLAGRIGAVLWLDRVPGTAEADDAKLFSESLCRFMVEVSPENAEAFLSALAGVPCAQVGMVDNGNILAIKAAEHGQLHAAIPVNQLEAAWRGPTVKPDAHALPPIVRHEKTHRAAVSSSSAVRVAILHAPGTNRDRDAVLACELVHAQPDILHISQLISGERRLADYHMLVVPGGFSYGDDLGAGKLWALDLQHRLGDSVSEFVASGRPVLGICNGFQALVKAGLLPGPNWTDNAPVTLTHNESQHFECRWVRLEPNAYSPCLFTVDLTEPIYCPVAHGEGRLVARDEATGIALWKDGLVALTYSDAQGRAAGYPDSPNGSDWGIAGLCNPTGNVLGLMPHPENHVFPWQHPRWHRHEQGMSGLPLFQNGVNYARR